MHGLEAEEEQEKEKVIAEPTKLPQCRAVDPAHAVCQFDRKQLAAHVHKRLLVRQQVFATMADVMSPPNASASDAQAAAAARKARRKKTRWGADVESAKDDTKVAQAGSTEIPSVTSAPGSVGTANTPPQQELTGLKLNSSVPSGTPVPGQPSHASASGQPVGFPTLVSSQGHTATASATAITAAATPPPWLAGHYAPTLYGGADTSKDATLPGPPPQPTAQQPWLPHSAPASHPSGPYAAHPAAGPHPGYGAEYYYQGSGGYPAPYLQLPTLLKPSPAEDDRPPGVEDAEEAPPGADPPAADGSSQPPSFLSGSATTAPEVAGSQPQSEPQLPGPPAAHPHPATAPPSFPTAANAAADAAGAYPTAAAAPYAQPYPHPYPQPQYPPQYALPEPAAEAEPGPPGDAEEPQAPGTEGDAPAAAEYGYPGGYTDPAYAYAQYGSYTDPQTGYTYPYDPQQAYGYDPAYYGYDPSSFAQYEAGAAPAVAPGAPAGEPGPPAGSPKKDPKAEDGKPAKPAPPVVQVKLPKQYVEKQQAKKREEEERRKQELMRQASEAEARRRAAAEEAAAAAARRAHLTDMTNGHAEEEQEIQFKDLDPEDQLLAASTPAEIRAAKKAVAAKEAAQKKAAAAEAAAAMPKSMPQVKEKEREPGQHERKRRTKSRWRDEEARDGEIDLKASKRRRASPGFEPRTKLGRPRSLSLSPPPMREPGMLRSPPRRRAPSREPSPERPKSRRPRGYRLRRSPSPEVSASPARYTPQPPQEHEPQPAPKPEPTEEEKAAAAAEAAASAREATPEVSEEGEIAVDPEELEEISKAQQQAASKQVHPQPHHHPAAKQASDRGRDRDRDRGVDRDRGHPGQERYSGGGWGDRGGRRRGRGRGGHQPDIGRHGRPGLDRSARPRDNYVRPPPGLPAPQMFAQYPQPQYQEEYDGYDDEGGAYEEPNIYAPQAYDAPYGVYGSAVGAAAVGQGVYGQYGS